MDVPGPAACSPPECQAAREDREAARVLRLRLPGLCRGLTRQLALEDGATLHATHPAQISRQPYSWIENRICQITGEATRYYQRRHENRGAHQERVISASG